LCGLAAKQKKMIFCHCVDENHSIRFSGMKPHGHYSIPLLNDGTLLGVIILYVPHGHVPQENEALFMETLGDAVASIIAKKSLEEDVRISHFEIEESRNETLGRLLSASEFRDTETGAHIKRMAEYSMTIGEKLGLSADQLRLLHHGAPMHDIGKIGIPDAILLKPGALTDEEFTIMKGHATIGAELLDGRTEYLSAAREIALSHHEKWDGSGYPGGLVGENIPLFGRICAVADVFDALTSKLPYKEEWPTEKAFALLEKEAGAHFDPQIVRAFLQCKEKVLRTKAIYQDEIINTDKALTVDGVEGLTGWLSWDSSLSVGIDVIDTQHQYLIMLANEIHDKSISGEGASIVVPTIKKMIDYSDIHFSNEEKMMGKLNFPYLDEHKKMHKYFIEKQKYFMDCIKSNPLIVGTEISFFRRDWLIQHIQKEDTKIRQDLNFQ
jgi:hemerythrin-like metal-binding protein